MAGNAAFFNHDSRVLNELFEALQRANAQDRPMRFQTGSSRMPDGSERAWLKFKVGEGMWSPPFHEDVDPYREPPGEPRGDAHEFTVTVDGCTADQAAGVMQERVDHEEDYGFPYGIRWDFA